MLNNVNSGWKRTFEKRLELLARVFPDIRIESAKRQYGMLKIDLRSENEDIQYILNCVSFKIERESAKVCESCGKYGIRRTDDPRLSEIKCLCMTCYALELDSILTQPEK